MLINVWMIKRKYSEIEKDSFEYEEIHKSTKIVKKSAKKSESKIVNQKETSIKAKKAKSKC